MTRLQLLSNGNALAFDNLFLQYFPKVKFFIRGLINNDSIAEDLAQDLFVKIWIKRKELVHVNNLNAYIYRMSRNIAFDYLQKKFHQFDSLSPDNKIASKDADITEIIYAQELDQLVDMTIQQMPEQRKLVYHLSREQGLSNQEIANTLTISKRTVETHLSVALADIRKMIKLLSVFFY